ncbi:MAG: hypothetical protein EBU90_18195 [Proteobacteria bacterium]|nr:hypothetical protein [Pseudomonadota bacterium]
MQYSVTHIFGVRSDAKIFHDYFAKFYQDVFIPYLLEHNIDTVFQLGDLFDKRKSINFYSLAESKRYFFDPLEENNIQLYTLVGNHDIYWRESLAINASDLLLTEYSNVHVISSPKAFTFDTTSFDIIPWVCEENQDEIMDFIKKSKSDICMGHWEIAGFSMYKGMEAHEGLNMDMFAKYEQVWSGHYHTRSQKGNITYVGTPAEMTWQDFNDPRGFHIFDTETRELTFVQNPFTIYHRLEYNDQVDLPNLDALNLKDCYVKVVVTNKSDFYKFDNFINKLYQKGCYDIKIVEDLSVFNDGIVNEEINLEDTVSVLSHYIDSVETNQDKEKIKHYMKILYTEALNITD